MPRRPRALLATAWLPLALALALVAAPAAPAGPPATDGGAGGGSTSAPGGSIEAEPSSATKAIEYVVSTQAADGGFFGIGQSAAGSGGLADTLVALAVDDGADWEELALAIDRLTGLAPTAATQPAYTARIVMAVVASGYDPTDFAGVDFVAHLERGLSAAGYWEPQNYANALAALGWAAAGNELSPQSVLWIVGNQCADGGWGWALACGSTSNVDTTALTLNALIAGGVSTDHPAVTRGRLFLTIAENEAGGFGERVDAETNANSTGLALSAIAALGEDPQQAPWNLGAGRDPLTQLLALQTADGGFLWKANSASMISNYATVQAIPGVAGVAYPVPPRAGSSNPPPCAMPGQAEAAPPQRCSPPGRR